MDTCVWGELAKSNTARAKFTPHFRLNGYVATFSAYTLFELSRAPKLLGDCDSLLLDAREVIHIAYLYDWVIDSEVGSYPNMWRMRWLPLARLVDKEHPDLLRTLASNSIFTGVRDEHRRFASDEFMNLEQLKSNYSPLNGEYYTPDEAVPFAREVALEYFDKHHQDFSPSFRPPRASFRVERIPSLLKYLYLFFKYYLHGQSPTESDFFDLAQVLYAPYSSVYVTERNACNVLNRIKKEGYALSGTRVCYWPDFLDEIEHVSQ